MTASLISTGVLIAFFGTLVAGFIPLLDTRTRALRTLAGWITAIACAVGAASGVLYLVTHAQQTLVIGEIPWLLHTQFVLDLWSAVIFTLVTGISAVVSVYSVGYLPQYEQTYHLPSLQFLTSIFIVGMQGVLLAGSTFPFMVCWELMSMSTFFLVLIDQEKASIKASFLYFIMTHLGAMALFGGFLILGQGALQFSFASAGAVVAAQALTPIAATGAFLLFFLGFGSKAGLVPWHAWLPEAHPQAPTPISALMSGVMLKVAVYGFIRALLLLAPAAVAPWVSWVVIVAAALSMIYGVLYSVVEKDIKRALAYSSIENMGLVFLLLGVAQFCGMQGGELTQVSFALVAFALFHCVNHAIFKSGLFLSAGIAVSVVHSRSMEVMGGLAKRMPIFAGFFLILALSAAALPPFGTFYGEWGILQTVMSALRMPSVSFAAQALLIGTLAAVSFTAGLALFAMVKLFSISMLGQARSTHTEHAHEPQASLLWSVGLLAVLAVGIGVFASTILRLVIGALPGMSVTDPMVVGHAMLAPFLVIGTGLLVVVLLVIVRRLVTNRQLERAYQTWDCGQPITSGMEYTATAFSAPIRFFFLFLLRTNKTVIATPVDARNPWIATRVFALRVRSVWYERLYQPIAHGLLQITKQVKLLQNGRIQFYVFLLFVALVVTLIVAV